MSCHTAGAAGKKVPGPPAPPCPRMVGWERPPPPHSPLHWAGWGGARAHRGRPPQGIQAGAEWLAAARGWRSPKGSSLIPSGGLWPCPHLGFKLLQTEQTSFCRSSTWFVVTSYGSPGTPARACAHPHHQWAFLFLPLALRVPSYKATIVAVTRLVPWVGLAVGWGTAGVQ